jgi:hypothetical protein
MTRVFIVLSVALVTPATAEPLAEPLPRLLAADPRDRDCVRARRRPRGAARPRAELRLQADVAQAGVRPGTRSAMAIYCLAQSPRAG